MGASSLVNNENISVKDVDDLQNGHYYQIVMSGGCNAAQYNLDCIAEHFVTNPNGGAVAFIGNASYGLSNEYMQYDSFLNTLYSLNENRLGIILENMSRMSFYTSYPVQSGPTDYVPSFIRLHLLGDPEMPVWSAVPQELDVDVSTSMRYDKKHMVSVRINNLPAGEEAVVCIEKATECYERFFISDNGTHQYVFSPKIGGTMQITVTARNFIPCVKTLNFTVNSQGVINIESLNELEDRQLKTGEDLSFDITLSSAIQPQKTTSAMATLTCSSPYITIDNPTVEYGSLLKNSTGVGDEKFRIHVSEDAPEIMRNQWNAACFTLTTVETGFSITDKKTSVDTFRVDIVSPRLRVASVKIVSTTDGDMIPEGGETVTFQYESVKLGNVSAVNEKWSIKPKSGGVLITSPVIDQPRYSFTLGKSYVAGDPLEFLIKLSDGDVLQDSVVVDFGATLPGIDAAKVHHTATESTISFHWDAMSGAAGYNIYRLEGRSYVKLNKMPLTTRYFEDDNVESRKKYSYKLSALTDGRVEGQMSETFEAMTIFPLMLQKVHTESYHYYNEGYTADIDYDGQQEIVQAGVMTNGGEYSSLLAVVRPDGTEPYDIDGNVTTFSGFAEFPYSICGAPTVADLYGNGTPGIITVPNSTSTEDGKNYVACHSSLDTDGDHKPDLLWRRDIGTNSYRGAAVTDIDITDSKYEKEIVVLGLNGYISVINADGSLRARFGNSAIASNYGGVAVADLNGDGKKEIICGGEGGVYVWKCDGTAFGKQPLFTKAGSKLKSAPVVCDINGDGVKEILIAERNAAAPDYVYAIRPDGTCLAGFDGSASAASIEYPCLLSGEGLNHAVSVGDIDGNGSLEVVSLGLGRVRAWSATGSTVLDCEVSGLFKSAAWATHLSVPIIADVDGDGVNDIVFSDGMTIYAINSDGSMIDGFPMSNTSGIDHALSVSDIDADGKNEIIASDWGSSINVWKTDGHGIGWGRARFDTGNTGEYVAGGGDPTVLTASKSWSGGTVNNDLVVGSGCTLTIPAGKELTLGSGRTLIVMDGGTVSMNGGAMRNANVWVKSGGALRMDGGAKIYVARYGGDVNIATGGSWTLIDGDVVSER